MPSTERGTDRPPDVSPVREDIKSDPLLTTIISSLSLRRPPLTALIQLIASLSGPSESFEPACPYVCNDYVCENIDEEPTISTM